MGVEILSGNELDDVGIRERLGRMGDPEGDRSRRPFLLRATAAASLTFLFFSNGAFRFACTKNGKIDGGVARHSR